jgi:hypothetical protein
LRALDAFAHRVEREQVEMMQRDFERLAANLARNLVAGNSCDDCLSNDDGDDCYPLAPFLAEPGGGPGGPGSNLFVRTRAYRPRLVCGAWGDRCVLLTRDWTPPVFEQLTAAGWTVVRLSKGLRGAVEAIL